MPAESVDVRYSKWNGADHWHFRTEVLGQDSHGRWLGLPAGSAGQRGGEPPIIWGHAAVLLVPIAGNWIATFNDLREPEIYVDVTTSPQVSATMVSAVDLDLDVVRFRDGRVEVLDEDEFAEHQVLMGYPGTLIREARATTEWLVSAISARAEPFGRAGAGWLSRIAPGG